MNQSLPETKQVKEKTSLDSDEEEASTAADIEKKTEGKTDRTTRRKSNERHIPALLRGENKCTSCSYSFPQYFANL